MASTQQIAKLAGATSRTLRHYDDVGLVAPSRVAERGSTANWRVSRSP